MKSFIVPPNYVRDFYLRSEIVLHKANASGSRVGLRADDTLQAFVKTASDQEDGFNIDCAHSEFLPDDFAQFRQDAWFAYKVAEKKGLSVLIDCNSKSITPMAPEFFVDSSVIEWAPEAANDN